MKENNPIHPDEGGSAQKKRKRSPRTLICLRSDSLYETRSALCSTKEMESLTSLFKCSMKTCKLTSSVKIAWPDAAPPPFPYIDALMCVVEGFNLLSKNLA